jgi:hypothetical protein
MRMALRGEYLALFPELNAYIFVLLRNEGISISMGYF